MSSRINPYISFQSECREAVEFYRSVFGGELTLSTFGQFGDSGPDADKIMHAQLDTPRGYTLMASDTSERMAHQPGSSITISLSGDERDELHGYWDQLAETGTISMPLAKQMWGDEFGMLTDQFGVGWMVNIAGSPSAQPHEQSQQH